MKRTSMSVAASIGFAALTAGAASAEPRYPTSTDEARAAGAERQASAPAPVTPCVTGRAPASTDEARADAAAWLEASPVVPSPSSDRAPRAAGRRAVGARGARLEASPVVSSPSPGRARRAPTSTDEARGLVQSRTSTQRDLGDAPPELPVCR